MGTHLCRHLLQDRLLNHANPRWFPKQNIIVVLPHKCPAVPDHPSDTLLHMPRHHATVPAKLAQMQSHQIRHRVNDVGQIFLQPPHMHLMALGAAVQLRGLHAHIVKSSMHTHVLMRLRHALTGAAPAGREAADASVFGCTAAGTACKSKSWLEVSNQKAYPEVGKTMNVPKVVIPRTTVNTTYQRWS